jgi:hypothetical protein
MATIIKNRTIRPSTRLEKSRSYKIDTKKVTSEDILIVNINHESNSFLATYKFQGAEVSTKNSISFRVTEIGNSIVISWSEVDPIKSAKGKTKIEKRLNLAKLVVQIQVVILKLHSNLSLILKQEF